MLFDTPIYFIFLLVVLGVYWPLRHRNQNRFLLLMSYVFYGWWDWRFLGLILVSTVVDFWCALWIAASEDLRLRRALLAVAVGMNLTFLGFFKYFNFFAESAVSALHALGIDVSVTTLTIILPPAISFYTFQELAYIVDVYHGRLKPSPSPIDYALFITLFPHLIAGPIQRPSHLLPQVQRPRHFDSERFYDGIMLVLSGLFRKMVIADNCALLADAAFGGRLGPPSVVVTAIGTYAFAWQIYGDFSGYSDIARGSAQLLGFHFMINFRQPYLATSLQDFWRRWHISLSTWLRDYLYIPLGGNRHGTARTYRNLIITMLLGGLWHGANWTFLIWGAMHGVGLALERLAGLTRLAPSRLVARLIVFHAVCVAWVFFRATSLQEAVSFLGGVGTWYWREEYFAALQFLALFSLPLLALDLLLEARDEEYLFQRSRERYRIAAATALLAATTFLAGNQANAFIYFQF